MTKEYLRSQDHAYLFLEMALPIVNNDVLVQ